MLKVEQDFHSPTLIQHMAARWLATGAYERHVNSTIPFYRERRDALMAALERHMAGEYQADPPEGGHHVWVTLARPLDERALYAEAGRRGVMFTPGGAVTAERRSQTSLRLSFSLLDPEQLDEGVRRLARRRPRGAAPVAAFRGRADVIEAVPRSLQLSVRASVAEDVHAGAFADARLGHARRRRRHLGRLVPADRHRPRPPRRRRWWRSAGSPSGR